MFTADSCCSRLRRLRKVTLLTLVGQPPLGVVGSTRSEEDTGRQGQVISGGVGISRRISVSLKALRWVPKACEQWVWCMNAESLICDCCCNVISGHGSFDVVSVNLIYLLSVEARWRHMAYHNTKYWGLLNQTRASGIRSIFRHIFGTDVWTSLTPYFWIIPLMFPWPGSLSGNAPIHNVTGSCWTFNKALHGLT